MSLALGLVAAAADTAGEGVARTLLGVSQLVSNSAINIRANKESAQVLSRRIDEMVQAVASELELDGHPTLDGKWKDALDSFIRVLRDTNDVLHALAQRAYLSQIIYRDEDKRKINQARSNVERAFDILKLNARVRTAAMIAEAQHSRDQTSLLEQLRSPSLSPPDASAHPSPTQLPSKPSLFFGRAAETEHVAVAISGAGQGHVAILGGPGFGKTTLALSALYHPDVVAFFGSRRYFIACDASDGPTDCLKIIAGHFGVVGSNDQSVRRALRFALSDGPTLLVLDNFESAWEASPRRADAEATLQFLAGIETVRIIITMRGAERPHNVAWSRPLLPPLSPLDIEAAKQVFASIADSAGSEDELSQLLAHTENVPLAVMLMANLAQYESLNALLTRWDAQRTQMLSKGKGSTPLTSLDVSIHLSIHCFRMQQCPSALQLLRLLALLPNGVVDTDISLWSDYDYQALETLLRVSLAVRTAERRIYVLAPIRGFVLTHMPPAEEHVASLYNYYFELVAANNGLGDVSSENEDINAVVHEISNIESLVEHAMTGTTYWKPAVQATAHICRLYVDTGLGSGNRLLDRSLTLTRAHGAKELTVDLLILQGKMRHNTGDVGAAAAALTEAEELATVLQLPTKIFDAVILSLYLSEPEHDAALRARLQTLADTLDDPVRSVKCTGQIAMSYKKRGLVEEAARLFHDAMRAYTAINLRQDRLYALMIMQMGQLHHLRGDHALAVGCLEDAISVCDTIRLSLYGGIARLFLGHIYLQQGYLAKSIPLLLAASESLKKWGSMDVLLVHALLCEAYLDRGDPDSAASHARIVQRFQQEMGWGKIYALMSYGALAHHLGDTEEVRAILSVMDVERRSGTAMIPDHYVAAEIAFLRGALAQELENDNAQACEAFIVCAIGRWKMGAAVDIAIALVQLAEVADDATSRVLLDTVMPQLYHFGSCKYIARTLLQSARLAKRCSDLNNARHRATSALRRYELLEDTRGCRTASAFLTELDCA